MKPNARIPRRARGERELRARDESSLSSSKSRRTKKAKEAGEQACYPSQTETLRQGLEGNFRFPRPCRFVARRFVFARELAVGKPLSEYLAHSESKATSIIKVFAIVIPESLLIKITIEMERLYAHIGSGDAALQQRPEILKSICVNATIHVLHRMVNDLVGVIGSQSFVGQERIAVQSRASRDVLSDFILQYFLAAIGNDSSANFPATFKDSHYRSLVLAACSGNPAFTFADMHVSCFATDEGLIYFNFAVELRAVEIILQREPKALEHEPRGFLSDTKCAVYFHAADAVLAVAEHPESRHPLVHAERGILEYRPNFNGELLVTSTAEPQAASLDEIVAVGTTAWTGHFAIRPAQLNGVIEAALRIGEVNDGFL